jgi:hypothetical protein
MLKNFSKTSITTIFFLTIFSFVFFAQPALAVDIFLFSAQQELPGDELVVSLGLDTGADRINTVSGELSYDQNILDLISTSNANSVIPLWVEAPASKTPGLVSFSGIVPGGFGGQGKIISLVFKSKIGDKDITKLVKVKKIEILRNDGAGTVVAVKIITPSVSLTNSLDISSVGDTNAPEPFKPILSRNDPLLGNQSYLIFNTTDKGSGIDKYFVIESPVKLNFKSGANLEQNFIWAPAESPYLLQDQTLSSHIYVKAVDRAGNDLVVELSQEKEFYQTWWFWLLIIILILFVVICGKLYRKKY